MGVYDTIYFDCPNCGEEVSSQSKSGPCLLREYKHTEVPLSVSYDANRHAPIECHSCGKKYYFGNIPDDVIDPGIALEIKEFAEER